MARVIRSESLTEEQRMIRDMVVEFVAGSVASHAVAIDAGSQIPTDLLVEVAELGLLGVPLSEDRGGAGFDFVSLGVVLSEISCECPALAQHILLQTVGGVLPLAEAGEQQSHLESVMMGDCVAAFIDLPEDGEWDGASGTFTGSASCVLGAADDGLFLILTGPRAEPVLLLVPGASATCGEAKGRLGMRGVSLCDVRFESASATVLAEGDSAAQIASSRRTRELVGALAIGAGLAQSVSQIACVYAREREQFGGPIARLGAVAEMMAQTDVAYHVASELSLALSRSLDRKEDVLNQARSARLVIGDLIMRSADCGLQIHGGYGFSREYAIERFYRDARHIAVMGGSADMLLEASAERLT